MPSPFPGMDPYLEDPDLWESFHNRFIGALDDLLEGRVRPHFYVEQQSTVYIVDVARAIRQPPIKPDLYLVQADSPSAVAVMERPITTPTIIEVRFPEEIRQRYLEIRDAKSHAVVAVIEVLSPTNKTRAGRGHAAFLRKRRAVMASPVHWLEIDLLRAGGRPAEVAGQSDYYALLKRGDDAARFPTWFSSLRDPLPVVAVPLTEGFPDVPLDLQAALTAVYDRHYAGRLDYAGPPPPPPLPPADAAWAEARVRAWRAAGSESASGQ